MNRKKTQKAPKAQPWKKIVRNRSYKEAVRGEGLWGDVIIQYLGGFCVYCGENKEKLNIHHIIPLLRGGENSMGNLELVCRICHNELHVQWRLIAPIKKVLSTNCFKCGRNFDVKVKTQKAICSTCRKDHRRLYQKRRRHEKNSSEA